MDNSRLLIFLAISLKLFGHVTSTCYLKHKYYRSGFDTILVQCEQSFDNLIYEIALLDIIPKNKNESGLNGSNISSKFNNDYFNLSLDIIQVDSFGDWSDEWSLDGRINTIAMSQSNMTEIPNKLFDFTNLVEIKIVNNQIKEINLDRFSLLGSLATLNVSHNAITVLKDHTTHSHNTNVKIIDMSYNFLQRLQSRCFQYYSQLLHLNLSHNIIRNIDMLTFEGISLLETLDISYNRLLEIDYSFMKFINLRKLILNDNNLTSLTNIHVKAMTKLKNLDLNSNLLNEIENGTLSSLTEPKKLNFSNNRTVSNQKPTDIYLSKNNTIKIKPEAIENINITFFNILFSNLLSGTTNNQSAPSHLPIIEKMSKNVTQHDEKDKNKYTYNDPVTAFDKKLQEKIQIILEFEKNKMIDEMKTILKNTENDRNNSDNNTQVLNNDANNFFINYFMYIKFASFVVLIIVSVVKLIRKLYKKKYKFYIENKLHLNEQPIDNVIELQGFTVVIDNNEKKKEVLRIV